MKVLRYYLLSIISGLFLCGSLYGQSYLEKGVDALKAQEYEKGMDFLKQALSESPDNEVAHFYLGFAYSALRRNEDAIQAYNDAIKKGSSNKDLLPEVYFYRALAYAELQNYNASVNDYTSALSFNSKNEKYLLGRGQAYSQMQNYIESDRDLNAVLKLDGDNIDARIWLAFNESQRGNIDKAIDQYDRIIKSHPDIAEPYRLRAAMYIEKEDYKKAVPDVVKALELQSTPAIGLLQQLARLSKDDLYPALEAAEKAKPTDSQWKYFRALALEINGDYEGAAGLYKKANLLLPSPQTSLRIASCYEKMRDWDNALKYADDAVKNDPENIYLLWTRAQYKYDLGDMESAIQDISKCIEIDPGDSELYYERAWYRRSKRDYEGARMDYSKAIAIEPEKPDAYANRGRVILLQGGNREVANEDFRKAIQLDSDLSKGYCAAPYALVSLGLIEEANEYMKKVIDARNRIGRDYSSTCYEAACIYSLTGEIEKAIYYLGQSIKYGYTHFYHFTRDTDLDNIRNEERFKELLKNTWPKSLAHLSPYGVRDENADFIAPQFNGGDSNMFSLWVNQRLVYPDNAKNNDIQGTVVLGFYIEEDGQIDDLKVIVDVDPELDAEALRVVKQSPSWTPAKKNGETIRYHYYFPIIFKLE